MDKELIITLQNEFNQISNTLEDASVEYWHARDLKKVLEYERWENFANVVQKAKIACENSSIEVSDHFSDVTKMVSIGSNTKTNRRYYAYKICLLSYCSKW